MPSCSGFGLPAIQERCAGTVRGPGEEGGDEYDPEEGLRRAVASYPLLVARLLAKLNDQGVGKGLDWQARPAAPGPAPPRSGVCAHVAARAPPVNNWALPAMNWALSVKNWALLLNDSGGRGGGVAFPSDACACCAHTASSCCWLVDDAIDSS